MIDRHDILVFTAEAQYAAGEPWITIAVTPTYLRAIEAASDLSGMRDFLGRLPVATRVASVPRRSGAAPAGHR